jgi:tetratricopeptide (TPR) repeat protein
MLPPETISALQGFGYGIAQNLIASLIVEGKKLKDDRKAHERAALLESYEHSKPLEERIAQKVCEGLRNLNLEKQQFELLLPLASDSMIGGELARQILADRYSSEEMAKLIVASAPSAKSIESEAVRLASLLVGAIQSAIADDPHLCRTKTLQFQSNISYQFAEVKAETAKTREAVQETGQHFIQALASGVQKLEATLKLLSDKTTEPETRERIYYDRVDQARKLLVAGKYKTARGMLEALRKEIDKLDTSKSLLFRIATNIGCCAIQLDDRETAIREIELAFQIDPENPKAVANLAAITLLKGQPEQSLRLAVKARQLTPKDSIATANYIQALFALGREGELERLIAEERWIETDANCCFAIGSLFFNKGRFADAERFFRLGLGADPTEPRLLMNLAHSLVCPIQTALRDQTILDWKFPPEAIPKLQEAEALITRAIAAEDEIEGRRLFGFAHTLRADVRRMLGNEAGAISDCEIALHVGSDDETALAIKGLAYLHAGKPNEAITSFEEIHSADARRNILIPLATAYNAAKQPEKVVSLLTPHWVASPSQPNQIKFADQLLWAYSRLQEDVPAKEVINRLETDWPKNPEALSAAGSYHAQIGKTDEAIALFTESLAYATGPLRDFIALQLGDLHYRKDDFAKAAELYESVADLTTDNELARKYLVCLYNSGPHKEALTLASRLRAKGEPLLVVSQIEANILAEIGDLKTAQQIMERLSQLHPRLFTFRIAAVEFAMRRGRHEEARLLLEQVPYEGIRTEANLLLRVAQLRAVLGMGRVLQYVYQARRVGFASPEIHAAYIWLFVSREQVDQIDLTKEAIDGDCGVILQIGNAAHAYTIVCEPDLHPDRGEITAERAKAMKLIGRRKGERFIFDKDAFGNDIECIVTEVQSKYARAFQETLKIFPTLFPGDRTLQGVNAPYEKLREGICRQLDEQQNAFRRAASFYEVKQATFEALAGVLHCPPIELWGMLTGGRYCTFANFSGSRPDAEAESATAAQSDSILLELTAVLTFGQLGLLERLAQRYKLFTTQPVIDTVLEAFAKIALSKPGMTVGKDGDNYIRHERTTEQLEANRKFLERLLKFLSESVSPLPVPSLLEKDGVTDGLRDILGPISIASIFAARAENIPLHSEDQMLRALARNEWRICGMSVQPILHELVVKNILTRDECVEATAKLFFMNYTVVLIGADNLIWTIQKVQYKITDELRKMLAVFHGPQCTFESAVEVLSETTKRLWIESSLYHLKIDLLDAILDALGTNRPTKQVAQYFTTAIKLKLFLVPNAANAIAHRVNLWKERKLGRGGIILPPHYRPQ